MSWNHTPLQRNLEDIFKSRTEIEEAIWDELVFFFFVPENVQKFWLYEMISRASDSQRDMRIMIIRASLAGRAVRSLQSRLVF